MVPTAVAETAVVTTILAILRTRCSNPEYHFLVSIEFEGGIRFEIFKKSAVTQLYICDWSTPVDFEKYLKMRNAFFKSNGWDFRADLLYPIDTHNPAPVNVKCPLSDISVVTEKFDKWAICHSIRQADSGSVRKVGMQHRPIKVEVIEVEESVEECAITPRPSAFIPASSASRRSKRESTPVTLFTPAPKVEHAPQAKRRTNEKTAREKLAAKQKELEDDEKALAKREKALIAREQKMLTAAPRQAAAAQRQTAAAPCLSAPAAPTEISSDVSFVRDLLNQQMAHGNNMNRQLTLANIMSNPTTVAAFQNEEIARLFFNAFSNSSAGQEASSASTTPR